jgi:hypothetical protein
VIDRTRFKGATILEWVAVDFLRDIDAAIRHRDAAQLRNFAYEAAASGLDQEATRCREIADVIESKAGASAREELTKIKAALQPPPPSQSDLVARWDSEQLAAAMSRGAPFNVNTFEADEARRAAEQNRQLAARQRRHEEKRAAQVAAAAEPKGPARR